MNHLTRIFAVVGFAIIATESIAAQSVQSLDWLDTKVSAAPETIDWSGVKSNAVQVPGWLGTKVAAASQATDWSSMNFNAVQVPGWLGTKAMD